MTSYPREQLERQSIDAQNPCVRYTPGRVHKFSSDCGGKDIPLPNLRTLGCGGWDLRAVNLSEWLQTEATMQKPYQEHPAEDFKFARRCIHISNTALYAAPTIPLLLLRNCMQKVWTFAIYNWGTLTLLDTSCQLPCFEKPSHHAKSRTALEHLVRETSCLAGPVVAILAALCRRMRRV